MATDTPFFIIFRRPRLKKPSDPSPGSFAKVVVAVGGAVYRKSKEPKERSTIECHHAAAATRRHSDTHSSHSREAYLEDDNIAAVHHLNRALRKKRTKSR